MATVFLFHGIGGNAQENWFPWMKKELDAAGHRCIVPNFPNPDQPVLEEWLEHFQRYVESVDEQTVLVGHSLGAAIALRLLERMQTRIHATFLVAPYWGLMDNQFDPITTSFSNIYDWKPIKDHAGHLTLLHGEGDPYIHLAKSKVLAEKLGIEMMFVPGAGHFNTTSGYIQFPVLRDLIMKEITS